MKRIIENLVTGLNSKDSRKVLQSYGFEDFKIEDTLQTILILNNRMKSMSGNTKELFLSELFGDKNVSKAKIVFSELEKYSYTC